MESFSDCSSIAPVMTSRDERQGDGMCEANGDIPGGIDKCSDDLLGLYVETKTDMLALVEEDLKLKLDIRSFKEDFRDVLVDFESYLEREAEFDNYWRDHGSPTSHGYRKHALRSPRRHSSPSRGDGKRKSRSRRNRESKCYSPRNLFPDRSGSRRQSMRQRKHNKQKPPSDGDRFVEYMIDSDPSRVSCSEKANSSLGEISSITKCSDFSIQEPHGDLAGLLHSTLNMEYNVSPTQHAREPVPRRQLLAQTPASQMDNLGHRPTPQGKECSESKKPLILQADCTPVRNCNPQSSSGNYSSSLDESTPIVRVRTGRRRSRDPRSTDEDSGLCHDSLTPKVKETSRGNEMFLDEMAREDRYLFDRREVNQIEAPLLPGFLEQPRHISERRTADGASFNTTYTVSSTMAHRHSQADVSDLTTLPSDSMQSSDITMSSMHFSPMTSCAESSYKESDANSPSIAENMTQASGEQSMPGMYNIRYRELIGGNYVENSGGSSLRAEIYPGHLPYSDTTDGTSDSSTQARFYRVDDPDSRHGYSETSSGEPYYKPGYAPYSSMVSSTSSGPCVPVNSLNNTNATSSSNIQFSDVSSPGHSIGCLPISTSARSNVSDIPNHPSNTTSGKSPPTRGGDMREKPPLPIPRPQCIAKELEDIYVDNINVLRQFPNEHKMDDMVMEVANTNSEQTSGEEKGSDSDKQLSKKSHVQGKSMGFFKRIGSIRRHFRKRSKSKATVADSDDS